MSESLFECPKCNGPHFNVGVNGTLICASVSKFTNFECKQGGCGWRGTLTQSLTQAKSNCDEDEGLIQQCAEVCRAEGCGLVATLQRRLRLGYTRAARIMDELEIRGIVGPHKGNGEPRDYLLKVN